MSDASQRQLDLSEYFITTPPLSDEALDIIEAVVAGEHVYEILAIITRLLAGEIGNPIYHCDHIRLSPIHKPCPTCGKSLKKGYLFIDGRWVVCEVCHGTGVADD